MIKKIGLLVCVGLWLFYGDLHAQTDIFNAVNSSYDEQNPVISPDFSALYFTRANHPNNVGGINNPGDIWKSARGVDGKWLKPVPVPTLNNYSWNGIIGFVDDGAAVLLHNHYSTGSMLKTQGISIAKKRGSGWGQPENIRIPYFKNTSSYFGGSLSDDGKVLVLALESYYTKGAEDLYVTFKTEKGWSELKNLGEVLNTRFQEFSPSLAGDSILYFASNGHGGQGSSDIFYSERLDDSWLNWSAPAPVEKVNTEGRELYYDRYEGFALYTSTTSSDGYGDIKILWDDDEEQMPDAEIQEQPIDTTTVLLTEVEELKPNEVQLYGTVVSSKTGVVLPNSIIKVTRGDLDLEDGAYSLTLTSPVEFVLTVEASGYITQQENFELASNEIQKIEKNFRLQPIEVGTKVNLENVLFKQSRADFFESSYAELDLVVELMKENPDMKIRLEGHTDNRGVPKHNLRLSKKRVAAVKDYLKSQGIAGSRISGKGYGGTRPIADNSDPEQRLLNRRVEFVIVKN